jgi:hypothetical protein
MSHVGSNLERDYAYCEHCGSMRRRSSLVTWTREVNETQAVKVTRCAEL